MRLTGLEPTRRMDTSTSSWPVYQFQHSRKSVLLKTASPVYQRISDLSSPFFIFFIFGLSSPFFIFFIFGLSSPFLFFRFRFVKPFFSFFVSGLSGSGENYSARKNFLGKALDSGGGRVYNKVILRVQPRSRSRAMEAREPCQAGNRAALNGMLHVTRGCRIRGCMRRISVPFQRSGSLGLAQALNRPARPEPAQNRPGG